MRIANRAGEWRNTIINQHRLRVDMKANSIITRDTAMEHSNMMIQECIRMKALGVTAKNMARARSSILSSKILLSQKMVTILIIINTSRNY